MANIKFVLDGCDISFVAEAPEDIALKQLLIQCDRIKPDWCACGIRSYESAYNESPENGLPTEIFITHNDVRKANEDVSCSILETKVVGE